MSNPELEGVPLESLYESYIDSTSFFRMVLRFRKLTVALHQRLPIIRGTTDVGRLQALSVVSPGWGSDKANEVVQ